MNKQILPILLPFFITNLFAQDSTKKLSISHLTGDFYIFTTYNLYKDTLIPANG